jgi:hypothetical protein
LSTSSSSSSSLLYQASVGRYDSRFNPTHSTLYPSSLSSPSSSSSSSSSPSQSSTSPLIHGGRHRRFDSGAVSPVVSLLINQRTSVVQLIPVRVCVCVCFLLCFACCVMCCRC